MKKTTLGIISFCLGIFLIYDGKFILESYESMTVSILEKDKKKYYGDIVSGTLLFLVLLAFFLHYILLMCKGKRKSFGFKFY
jgi:hypothetical protein